MDQVRIYLYGFTSGDITCCELELHVCWFAGEVKRRFGGILCGGQHYLCDIMTDFQIYDDAIFYSTDALLWCNCTEYR